MIKHTDVVIIGGGISGLSSAWWLSQLGIDVIVIEKSAQPGGMIGSTNQDGYLTEHAASMIMNFDSTVAQFIDDSGLQEQKVRRNEMSCRYMYTQSGLSKVPQTTTEFIMSDLLSRKSRMNLIGEIFRGKSQSTDETVAEFIRRRFDQEILDLAIDPYVSAILACDPQKACAKSTLPRLTRLEQTFGSITTGILAKKLIPGKKGLPHEAFSFGGGMKSLIDVLVKNTQAEMRLGEWVKALEPTKSGWCVTSSDETIEHQYYARNVIFSTPANVASTLLKPVHTPLAELLAQIEYAPIAQIHIAFNRAALAGFPCATGFLVPSKYNLPLSGSLWVSNLFPDRAPEDKILTSNVLGGACQPTVLNNPDSLIIDSTLATLEKICGLKHPPEMVRVNRHKQGLPLYHGAYHSLTKTIKSHAASSNGLYFAANYLDGISIRDRIIQGADIANQIVASKSASITARQSTVLAPHGAGRA